MTVVLLSAPRDPAAYQRLAQHLSAFDKDGNPAVELDEKPPGRLAILAGQATTSIQRTSVVIVSMATIVALLLAAALALLGRINLHMLLGYLR